MFTCNHTYRITTAMKDETDIIDSIIVWCDTGDNLCPVLQAWCDTGDNVCPVLQTWCDTGDNVCPVLQTWCSCFYL